MIFIEWLTIVGSNLLMWETNWLLSDSSLLKTDSDWLFSDSNEWFLYSDWLLWAVFINVRD
jgi:hypothetical protein